MMRYKVAMPRLGQTLSCSWRLIAAVVVVISAGPTPGLTQKSGDSPPAYEPGEVLKDARDPVVATIDGRDLHLSDLGESLRQLPPSLQTVPFETLYPALLDGLVEHAALEQKARRLHLDDDPDVRRRMNAAAGRVLEQALLEQIQKEKVTENAVRALYGETYGSKTTVDQVRVRLILLGSEDEAAKAMARLQAGENFATVARDVSRDPSSAQGGDLGFLRREQLQRDLADVAFSLHVGEITPRPVRTNVGWCIIKAEERASVPPPSFEAVHDELRRLLTFRTNKEAAVAARAAASVREFNLNGTPVTSESTRSPP
jgi:peptidyl-prolyl cis-trans isomerase C